DALLYSLSANATHGLQRGDTDYRRGYEIACRNELVDPANSDAVARLLQCSGATADRLTLRAREAARAERDATIVRMKDEGKSNREVARETGIPHTTVDRVVAAPKQSVIGMGQGVGFLSDTAKDDLRELSSPAAQNWSAALRALRLVNE